MKTFYKLLIFVIISLLTFSCSEYEIFNDITQVKNIEILGIQADRPDAHTMELITTQMLVAEPVNYNREYHKVWLLCDPQNHGETESGLVACMSSDIKDYIQIISDDTDTFSFKINKTSLEDYNLKAKYVYVIGGICEATLDECKNKLENVSKEVLFGEDSIFKVSFKRIRIVSDEYTISNTNPIIKDVFIDGENIGQNDNLTLSEDTEHNLKAIIDDSSFYGSIGEDEFMKISWKTNFGRFSKYETVQFYSNNDIESVNLTIDDNFKSLSNKKVYIIATNLRGGIAWKIINID